MVSEHGQRYDKIPLPAPLKLTGNVATEWKRFCSQWRNYEIAADLASTGSMRRAAVFLACVGNDAYQLFQTLDFETDEDRLNIDKVIDAFERYCIGEVT